MLVALGRLVELGCQEEGSDHVFNHFRVRDLVHFPNAWHSLALNLLVHH